MDERCIHRESIILNCSAIMVHALDLRFYDTSQNYSRSANLYTFCVDRTYFDILLNYFSGWSQSQYLKWISKILYEFIMKKKIFSYKFMHFFFIFKIQLMWVKIMKNPFAQNGLGFGFLLIIKCLKHYLFNKNLVVSQLKDYVISLHLFEKISQLKKN